MNAIHENQTPNEMRVIQKVEYRASNKMETQNPTKTFTYYWMNISASMLTEC